MRYRRDRSAAGAGARDKWVTLQALTEGESDSGFPTEDEWSDLATVAMAREDLEAVERARTAADIALGTTSWQMAYRADMDPERIDVPKLRRLQYLGRAYDILAAQPVGRHRVLELITEVHSQVEAP